MFGIKKMKELIETLNRSLYQKDKDICVLRLQICKLEEERKSNERETKKELEKLKWMIENPCPYKVGQKINGEIITEVYVYWFEPCSNFNILRKTQWMYKTVKPIK